MTRRAPARRPTAAIAAVTLALAAALAGCGSSDTTSSSGAAGAAPPATTSTTPTTATTTTSSGTSAPTGSAHGLSVSPAVGSPGSVMRFAVTPPNLAGAQDSGDISNALSVIGPQKPGCTGVHNQGLAALPQGQTTTVALGPAQLGGNWCPGTYTARVEILERPKCGQGMMCPQFIRVLAALGPVSFKISG
jgi:hypothetical protein